MITVIIPAKNEEMTIGHTIRVAKNCFLGLEKEIIVVCDEKTAEVARKEERVKVLVQKDGGKGNAMKMGFENSSGDVVVFTDADILNLDEKWIESTAEPVLDGRADVVVGAYKTKWFQVVTETVYRPLVKLLFPEVEGKISSQPLSGQRAMRRPVLEKIKFYPSIGVEAAMNIDLVHLRPTPKIEEVFLGTKADIYKSHRAELVREVVHAIVSKAKEYGRFSEIKNSNLPEVVRFFGEAMQECKL